MVQKVTKLCSEKKMFFYLKKQNVKKIFFQKLLVKKVSKRCSEKILKRIFCITSYGIQKFYIFILF